MSVICSPSFLQDTQSSMQTGAVSGCESQDLVSLIIFVHEADDARTQILTKSHGISSSAEKW